MNAHCWSIDIAKLRKIEKRIPDLCACVCVFVCMFVICIPVCRISTNFSKKLLTAWRYIIALFFSAAFLITSPLPHNQCNKYCNRQNEANVKKKPNKKINNLNL